ncbi:hypothetical protein HY483_04435 [Candidatus Woesearchaeota archaeon]|nr:hypothetical protein [Candidatus Woesearchaeota archaeon]
MTDIDIAHLHNDIVQLKNDVQIIKHILSEEGKLTDWAKNELKKTREIPEEEYVNIDDI